MKYSYCRVNNLPKKFIDYEIEDFSFGNGNNEIEKHNIKEFKKVVNYYKNLEQNIEKGRGIIICGPVGVMKTSMLTVISKKAIEIFKNWYFQSNEEIRFLHRLYFIQATTLGQLMFRTGLDESELRLRKSLKTITVLVIDDLTKISETKNHHEIVFLDDIIRYRDLNLLPTFYSCQIPFEKIKEVLGEPIYDIIRGNCEVIEFRGKSKR